jgi:fatty-acyl-CoA synthase
MQADMSWFTVLAHHATCTPDKPITVFEGQNTTYADMAAGAAALAGGLSERGVGRGDVVALLSYNCTEFVETCSRRTT